MEATLSPLLHSATSATIYRVDTGGFVSNRVKMYAMLLESKVQSTISVAILRDDIDFIAILVSLHRAAKSFRIQCFDMWSL
jgi:hypothetical protein